MPSVHGASRVQGRAVQTRRRSRASTAPGPVEQAVAAAAAAQQESVESRGRTVEQGTLPAVCRDPRAESREQRSERVALQRTHRVQ